MSLTALSLLLAAFAVHAAPTRTQVKMKDWFEPDCQLDEMIETLLEDFIKIVPISAKKANIAFKRLKYLALKSPDDHCSPQFNNFELIDVFDLVWGAYTMLERHRSAGEAKREEVYVQNLEPYWNFLPQMYGKAQRLIEEGHYCKNQWCAGQESSRRMSLASNGTTDANIVLYRAEKELKRVQNVPIRGSNRIYSPICTRKQINKERICGGFGDYVFIYE